MSAMHKNSYLECFTTNTFANEKTFMLNVYFAVAANRVIVDSVTNQVSIIDLFENLKSTDFPVLVPKLSFLFYVSREKQDAPVHDLNLVCELEDKSIFEVSVQLEFKNENTTRLVLGVDGLTLPHAGVLKARLMDKTVELGALDLAIEQMQSLATNTKPGLAH
ncbi:hypothetical protein B9Z35_05890 [Limnohabitans sp. Jir61]|nr:hypothetical protein B9Z35_05890 [Limnohabitans sp. Jir61]